MSKLKFKCKKLKGSKKYFKYFLSVKNVALKCTKRDVEVQRLYSQKITGSRTELC